MFVLVVVPLTLVVPPVVPLVAPLVLVVPVVDPEVAVVVPFAVLLTTVVSIDTV